MQSRYFSKIFQIEGETFTQILQKFKINIFALPHTIFLLSTQLQISLSENSRTGVHLLVPSRFKMRRFGGTHVHRPSSNPPGCFSPGKPPNADRFGETRKVLLPPKVIAHTAVGRFAPTKIDGARADNEDGPVISRAIPFASAFAAIFGNGPTTVELSLAASIEHSTSPIFH